MVKLFQQPAEPGDAAAAAAGSFGYDIAEAGQFAGSVFVKIVLQRKDIIIGDIVKFFKQGIDIRSGFFGGGQSGDFFQQRPGVFAHGFVFENVKNILILGGGKQGADSVDGKIVPKSGRGVFGNPAVERSRVKQLFYGFGRAGRIIFADA